MICVSEDGIHYNETQLVGGPSDSHVALRLRDTSVEVRRVEQGLAEITVTLVTSDDLLLG